MRGRISKIYSAILAAALAAACLYIAKRPVPTQSQAAEQSAPERPRAQTDILGYFFVPDPDLPNAYCGIAYFYKKNAAITARMVAVYHNGKIDDTANNPLERTKGVPNNPFVCKFDFINNLVLQGDKYIGKVTDPDTNRTYRCRVWFDTKLQKLVVRGELLFFGLNQYWTPSKPLPKDIFDPESLK